MLEYMALLGLSLCGGSSISISLLCLYLSGSEGEPTADTGHAIQRKTRHADTGSSTSRLCCLPLMVEGAEFIIWEGAEWVELRLEEEGLACSKEVKRTNKIFTHTGGSWCLQRVGGPGWGGLGGGPGQQRPSSAQRGGPSC